MTRTMRFAAAIMALTLAACGTSGSNPPELSEVHFTVKGLGVPAQFAVTNLSAGGVRFSSLDDRQFVLSDTLDFIIENAAPNYSGTFMRTGDNRNEIKVSLNFASTTGRIQPTIEDQTSPLQTSITESNPEAVIPASPLPASNPEVRIDVCQPKSLESSCMVIGDPQTPIDVGNAGTFFTGSIGDGVATRLVGGPQGVTFATVPAIFFLVDARDNVNAVFRSAQGQNLLVRLYVNGALRATNSGTKDVVIREDL